MRRYYQIIEHEEHLLPYEVQAVYEDTFETLCYAQDEEAAELIVSALNKARKPKDCLKVEL